MYAIYEGKTTPFGQWSILICVAADEGIRAAYENCSFHWILPLRQRDCEQKVELRYRLHLTCRLGPLVQRRPRWIWNVMRRPRAALIRDLPLSTPYRATGNQLKTWATQGLPGTSLWITSPLLRMMENALGQRFKENYRAWSAFISNAGIRISKTPSLQIINVWMEQRIIIAFTAENKCIHYWM